MDGVEPQLKLDLVHFNLKILSLVRNRFASSARKEVQHFTLNCTTSTNVVLPVRYSGMMSQLKSAYFIKNIHKITNISLNNWNCFTGSVAMQNMCGDILDGASTQWCMCVFTEAIAKINVCSCFFTSMHNKITWFLLNVVQWKIDIRARKISPETYTKFFDNSFRRQISQVYFATECGQQRLFLS